MMHYHAFSFFYPKRESQRSSKAKKEESAALVWELFHKPIKSPRSFLSVIEVMLTFRPQPLVHQ